MYSTPRTSLEKREQELSFDNKLDGVSGFIVAVMDTLKSVRIYLIALVDYIETNTFQKSKKYKLFSSFR